MSRLSRRRSSSGGTTPVGGWAGLRQIRIRHASILLLKCRPPRCRPQTCLHYRIHKYYYRSSRLVRMIIVLVVVLQQLHDFVNEAHRLRNKLHCIDTPSSIFVEEDCMKGVADEFSGSCWRFCGFSEDTDSRRAGDGFRVRLTGVRLEDPGEGVAIGSIEAGRVTGNGEGR
jgi:hypothetical protein